MPTPIVNKPMQKAFLTTNQLSGFRKGPRANIVIGSGDKRYIGLEGASVKLLAHVSETAQKKLLDERGTVLSIPNGDKKAILWIYKCMQAGEQDLEAFEALTTDTLFNIYQHCAFLKYESLMKRG